MTTLLRPGIDKILRAFHEERGASIHLRELSRKTGLTGQSITRHLALLEKNNVLESNREGNQRRYRLTTAKHTCALLALFDIERFERLPRIRQQGITTFLQVLPQQPVYAILFGSTAKENYNKGSDVDILIITNERTETKTAEKEADALHATRISAFQMTREAFKKELRLKEDNVIQSAVRTGYPLINHIRYYEEINHEGI